MAISWADNVNQKIIDSTQITIGEGGYIEDKSSNGVVSERRLSTLASPDTFNVVMDFDFAELDANGYSEFDRFINWYKYVHKRGTIPFKFPAITRFGIDGPRNPVNPFTGEEQLCWYKITSAAKPQKSGLAMRCSMTWVEVYSGPGITVIPSTLAMDRMIVQNGHIQMFFNHKPAEPVSEEAFTLEYKLTTDADYTEAAITHMVVDGNRYLFDFDDLEDGTYFVRLNWNDTNLTEYLEVS